MQKREKFLSLIDSTRTVICCVAIAILATGCTMEAEQKEQKPVDINVHVTVDDAGTPVTPDNPSEGEGEGEGETPVIPDNPSEGEGEPDADVSVPDTTRHYADATVDPADPSETEHPLQSADCGSRQYADPDAGTPDTGTVDPADNCDSPLGCLQYATEDAGTAEPDVSTEPDVSETPDPDPVCIPGQSFGCFCATGSPGAQDCSDDGTHLEACECEESGEGEGEERVVQICVPNITADCECADGADGSKSCDVSGGFWYPCECEDEPQPECVDDSDCGQRQNLCDPRPACSVHGTCYTIPVCREGYVCHVVANDGPAESCDLPEAPPECVTDDDCGIQADDCDDRPACYSGECVYTPVCREGLLCSYSDMISDTVCQQPAECQRNNDCPAAKPFCVDGDLNLEPAALCQTCQMSDSNSDGIQDGCSATTPQCYWVPVSQPAGPYGQFSEEVHSCGCTANSCGVGQLCNRDHACVADPNYIPPAPPVPLATNAPISCHFNHCAAGVVNVKVWWYANGYEEWVHCDSGVFETTENELCNWGRPNFAMNADDWATGGQIQPDCHGRTFQVINPVEHPEQAAQGKREVHFTDFRCN